MDSNELLDKARRLVALRQSALESGNAELAAQAEQHLKAIRVQISSPQNFGAPAPEAPKEAPPAPANLSPWPGEPTQPVSRDSFLSKPGGFTTAALTALPVKTGFGKGATLARMAANAGSTALIGDLQRMDKEGAGYRPDDNTLTNAVLGGFGGEIFYRAMPHWAPGLPATANSKGAMGGKELVLEGVPLTTGQAVDKTKMPGKILSNLEEATGSSVFGAGVGNARQRAREVGVQKLAQNTAGQYADMPAEYRLQPGADPRDFLGQLKQNFSNAYDEVLNQPGKLASVPKAQVDRWGQEVGLDELPLSPQLNKYSYNWKQGDPNVEMPYEGLQAYRQRYSAQASKYDKAAVGANDRADRDMAAILRDKATGVRDILKDQDPATYSRWKAVDDVRGQTQPIIDALTKKGDVWPSPSEVKTSVIQNAKKRGGTFDDFSESRMLSGLTRETGDRVRDSGTAGRVNALFALQHTIPSMLGAGAGYGLGGGMGAALGAGLGNLIPAGVGSVLTSKLGRTAILEAGDQITPARIAAILQQMNDEEQQ